MVMSLPIRYSPMAIAQPIEIPTISTYHKIYEANNATYFTQYIGPSSIAINPSLLPGDVLVDIESDTISYSGSKNCPNVWPFFK